MRTVVWRGHGYGVRKFECIVVLPPVSIYLSATFANYWGFRISTVQYLNAQYMAQWTRVSFDFNCSVDF